MLVEEKEGKEEKEEKKRKRNRDGLTYEGILEYKFAKAKLERDQEIEKRHIRERDDLDAEYL